MAGRSHALRLTASPVADASGSCISPAACHHEQDARALPPASVRRMNPSLALFLLALLPAAAPPAEDTLSMRPAKITLSGKVARQQLLVTLVTASREADKTRSARFRS